MKGRTERPRRSPRRSGAVLVLLTPGERESLRALAAAAGLGLGPWLRSLALARLQRHGQPVD